MGGTRGRHGPRAAQVALSTEGRHDTTVGIRGAKPNHHACRWLGITVGGKAVLETQACLDIYKEKRAARAGMWRKWISPRVRRLDFKAVVASLVAKGTSRTGGRGTDRW